MTEVDLLPEELPPLRAEPPAPRPEVKTYALANGLTVWHARRAHPLATVLVSVRGGASDDGPEEPGLSALLAASLREGTARRSGAELAALLQSVGAELQASSGPDGLTLAASGLSSGLETLLGALADVAANAAFPEAGVRRVKALAREELRANEAEPAFLAGRALARAVYGTHPYAAVSPTAALVDEVSSESLRRAARRRLVPARALVVVVGGGDGDAVRTAVEAAFGAWRGEGDECRSVPPVPAPAPGRRVLVVDRPGSVQTSLLVGGLGVARRDPDAFALSLAVAVYGGTFSSRMVTNLREAKGYTYSPGASASLRAAAGPVVTHAAVRNEVTGASVNEILYELHRMATTDPTDEELSRAKRREAGAFALSLETGAGLAGELAAAWLAGLPPDSIGDYVRALDGLSSADVRRVSRLYLASPALHVVAVGRADVAERELSPLGLPIERVVDDAVSDLSQNREPEIRVRERDL